MASGDNGLAALFDALGVGNRSVKTDRGFQLDAFGNLKNQAATTGGEGADATGKALSYFSDITGGSPTAVAGAVAPATNAAAADAAAQGRTIAASGTSRTGGTNSLLQQLSDILAGKKQDAINAAVPGAASTLGSLGSTLTSQSIGASGTLGSQAFGAHQADQKQSNMDMDALTKMFAGTKTGGDVAGLIAGL